MNRTNWEHGLFALIIQAGLAYWFGWAAAGAIAVGIFFGREYGQVERKVRARTGRTLTDMMPWHVLRPSLWSRDALLDVAVTILLVSLASWLAALL